MQRLLKLFQIIMFQTEIKFITDFTLNHVKKLGAFFTFERLLETNIHPAIKQYLNAEFDFLIFEDRQKLIQGSLFDYSGPKIHHHFSLIAEEIKKTKKVSYEDIKILISRAVSFNLSFILKPNWSLQKLIFGDKKNVLVNELELVLNYLYYYDYFKNVFKAYLSKRNITSLSATEFELILNKIDRELFSAHFEKLVDNSLYSIADFFSIGGLTKRNLSVESVEIFLKEKNLIDHLLKLKRAIPDPERKKYDIDDIRRIIYSATPVEPETVTPTAEDDDTEVEGDFEKVKTLEEAEIKPFAQSEESLAEENLSDEMIIQDLIQDEIVKQDIEELIYDEPEAEETEALKVNPEEEVVIPDSESIDENENLISEEEEIRETKKKKRKSKSNKEKAEEVNTDSEQEEVKSDEPAEKEFNISDVIEDEPVKEEKIEEQESVPTPDEEILDIVSEDGYEIEDDSDLLSDKEEEDLFSFYDEELKEIDELAEEEEVINLDELEASIKKNQDKKDSKAKADEKENSEELEKIQIEKDETFIPDIADEKIEIETVSDEAELPEVNRKRNKDIFSFLNPKEINKITDSIFNSDSEDFANTIEKISECANFDKATEILKALFISSKITPQSKPAVTLTNAVANYFDQV